MPGHAARAWTNSSESHVRQRSSKQCSETISPSRTPGTRAATGSLGRPKGAIFGSVVRTQGRPLQGLRIPFPPSGEPSARLDQLREPEDEESADGTSTSAAAYGLLQALPDGDHRRRGSPWFVTSCKESDCARNIARFRWGHRPADADRALDAPGSGNGGRLDVAFAARRVAGAGRADPERG